MSDIKKIGTFRICQSMAKDLDLELVEKVTCIDIQKNRWTMHTVHSIDGLHGFLVGLRMGQEDKGTKELVHYLRHLHSLHELIAEGKGESAEASELRDKMDHHWDRLTKEGLNIARKVSAAFYKDKEK